MFDPIHDSIHRAVMCQEVIRTLRPEPGKIIVDCTVGGAGHAQEILKAIIPGGKLVGIDRDQKALAIARQRLEQFKESCILIHDDFRNLTKILEGLNIERVGGAVFDLGLSSHQLEKAERGFSIKLDGPLDMRMDERGKISAFDLVNYLTEKEISKLLEDFGQERWHSRIAARIVRERKTKPIATTAQLANIILDAIPYRGRGKIHPATRTFQALRIAVNRELEAMEIGIPQAIKLLGSGGRICVISFHSLEDRIVKWEFRKFASSGTVNILTKKPLKPSQEEVMENPRARSAKLRVAEKV